MIVSTFNLGNIGLTICFLIGYNDFMWILKKKCQTRVDQVKIVFFSILMESHGIPWDLSGLPGKAVQIGFRVLH